MNCTVCGHDFFKGEKHSCVENLKQQLTEKQMECELLKQENDACRAFVAEDCKHCNDIEEENKKLQAENDELMRLLPPQCYKEITDLKKMIKDSRESFVCHRPEYAIKRFLQQTEKWSE